MNLIINFIINFIQLFVESAPWLMLGLVIAGLMKSAIPEGFLAKHLGKPGFVSTVKAALLGAPLPLCSCGVIPAAMGLRRSGASKSATTAFLISTPETGVDSISISYALLGPFMAIIRPIAAVSSAIVAGILVGQDDDADGLGKNLPKTESAQSGCCSKKAKAVGIASPSIRQRINSGLHFTFIKLVQDIALWLFVGLVFAAVIKTYVPTEFLTQWGDSWLAFMVMAAIGVPMYICATASTPIAAGLLFSGVSPGAVLVFMLVGPATNVATVGLVKRELGHRALAAYLGSVVGVGFAFGFLTNYLVDLWNMDFTVQLEHAHEIINPTLAYILSAILAMLMVHAVIRKQRKQQAVV